MIKSISLAIVLLLFTFHLSAHASDIHNCQELQNINTNLSGSYVLVNDIDCSDTINWNAGAGFRPISTGNLDPDFSGSLDGQGHVISNLYIDGYLTSKFSPTGLFARTLNAQLRNITLNNITVKGGVYEVGGLVGYATGTTIENVIIQNGSVVGSLEDQGGGKKVGGLVGQLRENAIIKSCSSTATVSGAQAVGGLVGINRGLITESFVGSTNIVLMSLGDIGGLVGRNQNLQPNNTGITQIINSYAMAHIQSNVPSNNVGGLVGLNDSTGTIINSYDSSSINYSVQPANVGGLVGFNSLTNVNAIQASFWDKLTTGQLHSAGSSDSFGKVTSEMQTQSTFVGWDFVNIWGISEGQDYPHLGWEIKVTPIIHNCHELQNMNNNLSGNYVLANDIDCSDTKNWNGGQGFIPVGWNPNSFNVGFKGNLDGQGHKISKLFEDPNVGIGTTNVSIGTTGLFTVISAGSVQNVKLENVSIKSQPYGCAGGLVGNTWYDGIHPILIQNVQVSGSISGDYCAGGIVGSASGVSITNSSSSATVEAPGNLGGAGGLAGFFIGNIQKSFASGQVTSNGSMGGLVGIIHGSTSSITDSYSTTQLILNGLVDSASVGGLVGDANNAGSILNTYAAGNVGIGTGTATVTGVLNLGGLVGNNLNTTVTASAWDKQTTGQVHSAGSPDSNGYNTTQFVQTVPLFNWDFLNTWIADFKDYPQLRWQLEPAASLWNSFNEVSREQELLNATVPPDIQIQRQGVNWPNIDTAFYNGVNWANLAVLSRPYYWNDMPVPIANVNWYDLQVLSKTQVNWADVGVLSKSNINWASVNPLVKSGINWYDWSISTRSGINWNDFAVLTQTRINWQSLSVINKTGINWYDWSVATRTGINWQAMASLSTGGTFGGVNWSNIGTSNNAINWQGVNTLTHKNIDWSTVSQWSKQGVNFDNQSTLNSVGMNPGDLVTVRTLGSGNEGYYLKSYDQWKSQYFTPAELGNAAISGDNADPDNDGIVNLAEYAFNLNPRVADSSAYQYRILNNHFTIKYRQNINATDVGIRIGTKTDLFSGWSYGSFSTVTSSIDASTNLVTATDSVDVTTVPMRFFRLEVAKVSGGAPVMMGLAADLSKLYYSLSVDTQGQGTVKSTSGSINCGNLCTAQALKGTTETLTATPASGYQFNGWSGTCSGTATQCTVTYSAATSVGATFTVIPVNGACGSTLNSCTTGTLQDTTDTSTQYLWNCVGSNGGTTANCSLPIPVVTISGISSLSVDEGKLVHVKMTVSGNKNDKLQLTAKLADGSDLSTIGAKLTLNKNGQKLIGTLNWKAKYLNGGSTKVVFTAQNQNGSSATSTVTITVTPLPDLQIASIQLEKVSAPGVPVPLNKIHGGVAYRVVAALVNAGSAGSNQQVQMSSTVYIGATYPSGNPIVVTTAVPVPGQSQSVVAIKSIKFDSIPYSIGVIADPNNKIKESNENNNSKGVFFFVK